jgi:hypothetical protein
MPIRMIAAFAALLFALPAHAAERSFLVGSFEELTVEGDIHVVLTTGKPPSANASGDKARLGALKIDRQGQTVRIRLQGLQANRATGEPVRVALSGRNVRKLVLNGNGRISVNDVNMPSVRIEIRGSGEIDVAKLESDRFIALLIGSGKLAVGAGATRDSEIMIDGAPTVAARGLISDKLRLRQTGPAQTRFTVNRSAEITNSGTGSITIDGEGTCFIREAGGATISCKTTG